MLESANANLEHMNDEVNKCQIQVKTNYIEGQSSLFSTFFERDVIFVISDKKWMVVIAKIINYSSFYNARLM